MNRVRRKKLGRIWLATGSRTRLFSFGQVIVKLQNQIQFS
ncbi:hypothetical protein LEP1GSC127_0614 [Leptospira kirschneri str. 200801925]|nr:hypothetical protein LEP1GSC127_0614 [Leptospira kirschneri str. 200801925]